MIEQDYIDDWEQANRENQNEDYLIDIGNQSFQFQMSKIADIYYGALDEAFEAGIINEVVRDTGREKIKDSFTMESGVFWMMEFIDTGLLGVILATVIYLVKKTTTLCHDVEKLKKWLLPKLIHL